MFAEFQQPQTKKSGEANLNDPRTGYNLSLFRPIGRGDRQAAFGHTWAEAMAFALRIEGRGAEVEVRWEAVDDR